MVLSHPRMIALITAAVSLLASLFFLGRVAMSMHPKGEVHVAPALRDPSSVSAASMASIPGGPPSFYTLEEMQMNVENHDPREVHLLSMKIELELFGPDGKSLVEGRTSGVKNAIIEAVRGQKMENLRTVSGKLYFKEVLVGRINTFFNQAVVRDVHFSQFLLK